jgi:hypothetical protein
MNPHGIEEKLLLNPGRPDGTDMLAARDCCARLRGFGVERRGSPAGTASTSQTAHSRTARERRGRHRVEGARAAPADSGGAALYVPHQRRHSALGRRQASGCPGRVPGVEVARIDSNKPAGGFGESEPGSPNLFWFSSTGQGSTPRCSPAYLRGPTVIMMKGGAGLLPVGELSGTLRSSTAARALQETGSTC